MTVPKRDRVLIPVTILNGAALSNELNVNGMQIVGIEMPVGWTSAAITFQAVIRETSGLPKTTTYGEIVDNGGTAVATGTVAPDQYVSLGGATSPLALLGLGRIRLRSGTSGAPVNQGAQRDFFLVCLT